MTDVALTLTEQLRAAGVVGACVEFFGPAAGALTVPDRATLANMAPEYGATTGFWPVDEQTITYLRMTGRSAEHVALVEAHARAAGLFRSADAADPVYDRVIACDLGKMRRKIAGPGMPHIRQDTSGVAASFRERAKGAAVAKPPNAGRPAGRRHRDCGHHLLHEYLQSARDDPRRACCQGRGRARIEAGAMGQDIACARLARRYDLSGPRRIAGAAGGARVSASSAMAARRVPANRGRSSPLPPARWSRTAAPLRLSSRATAISMGASTVRWAQAIFARPRWSSPSRSPGA